MRLIFTRHGQTEWNLQKRMQGSQDSALTPLGRKQAQALGKRLQLLPIDAVYASPLPRAQDTARLLIKKRSVPIFTDERLAEASLGAFEGMTMPQALEYFPEQADNFMHDPDEFSPVGDGESFHEVRTRVAAFLSQFDPEDQRTVLVVAHALVLRVIRLELFGYPLGRLGEVSVPSCCYCEALLNPLGWEVVAFGENWHHAPSFKEGHWYVGKHTPRGVAPIGTIVTPFASLARAIGSDPVRMEIGLNGHIDYDGHHVSRLYRVMQLNPNDLEVFESREIPLYRAWKLKTPHKIAPASLRKVRGRDPLAL